MGGGGGGRGAELRKGRGLSVESAWGFKWKVKKERKCTVLSHPAIPCTPWISVSRMFPSVLAF